MTAIHVDDLIREIDLLASEAGPEPPFPQLEVQQLMPTLREHAVVDPRPPLIGRTRYERLWMRINTIVRRVAAHAVEPAVAQQNEFNAALLDAIDGLTRADAALRAQVIALRSDQIEERNGGA